MDKRSTMGILFAVILLSFLFFGCTNISIKSHPVVGCWQVSGMGIGMTIQVNNDGTFELNSPLASYGGKWTRINDNTIKMTYLTPASKGEVQNSTLTYDNNTDTVMIDNNTAEALYRCQPKQ